VSDKKSTYGIIGDPVAHSLSPLMQNTAFEALEADAVYKLFPLKADELDSFFEKLRDEDSPIFGLNVTVPYKENVLKYMDALSPFAQKAMAVNTVCISKKRKLTGHNTDGPGFLAHLAELQFNTKDKKIAVLGAGGTTRAIIATLCCLPERPESIRIYNRNSLRAEELIRDLGERNDVGCVQVVSAIDDLDIESADLLINATSVGLDKEDRCLVNADLLHSKMLVYDVVYDPPQTQLLQLAKEKGAQTANGLGMLFYQGVLSLEHWADTQVDETVKIKMRESLEAGL